MTLLRIYRLALALMTVALVAVSLAYVREHQQAEATLHEERDTFKARLKALQADHDRLQGSAVMWNLAYTENSCGNARQTEEDIAKTLFPLTDADYTDVGKRIREEKPMPHHLSYTFQPTQRSDRRYLPAGVALLNEGMTRQFDVVRSFDP